MTRVRHVACQTRAHERLQTCPLGRACSLSASAAVTEQVAGGGAKEELVGWSRTHERLVGAGWGCSSPKEEMTSRNPHRSGQLVLLRAVLMR